MTRRLALLLWWVGCTPAQDPQAFLEREASFLRAGVDPEQEEREVRRVLAQRGLRVNARLEQAGFIALSAASRDGRLSAVRVITPRGVVLAEDAASDDLFQPSRLALLEHFGGTLGELTLLAYARIPAGQDVGCVSLQRVLPDANLVPCQFDVAELGARACVANLAPGRNGRVSAKIAWPSLHALTTPQLDVELAFDDPNQGRVESLLEDGPALPVSPIPVARIARGGEWFERERNRYATLRLAKANFSERHAAGVARAALARLAGDDKATQVDAYRNAIGEVLPGSPEAHIVADTLHHIQQDWLDAPAVPAAPKDKDRPDEDSPHDSAQPLDSEDAPFEEDALVIEPTPP